MEYLIIYIVCGLLVTGVLFFRIGEERMINTGVDVIFLSAIICTLAFPLFIGMFLGAFIKGRKDIKQK